MKQLLLIRHGKSEWGNEHLADADRPLNPRGHRDAPEMATRILQKGLSPQSIVSSPALRALTTARHFEQVWFPSAEVIKTHPDIYEADVTTLLNVVNSLSNDYERVALFGHNPGFTDFANYLSNANIYNVPTCGVVLLEFESDDWAEISSGTGTLIDFDYPKSPDED
ncbi:MAG: histidine phosphatase family protein [Pedobacter sp.]|nr:MAG: histidine phosphatase family protein [Pedobacter sp.]